MEDQNGLNLSLGLPCGRVTASQKGKTWNSSNDRTEEGERNNNVIGDVKNFLDGGPKLLDSVIGLQRSDLAKNEGSFFNDLSSTVHTDPTKRLNSGGFLVPNGGRYIEVEEVEEKTTDKNLYGESNNKRKRDRDSHDKTMTSHISINTDDDSTGDNEDVTDSEAESSDQVEINNEEVNGFKISSEKEVKFGNMSHGPLFSQSVNVINIPYSIPLKDSNDPIYSGTNALVNSNMPRMFGYSHVQLSSVDEGKFCAPASHLHSQHLHPTNARGSLNSDKHSADINITQASSHPVVAIKSPSNGTHPHAAEEGSSKNVKGNNNISFRDPADTSSERPKAGDGLPPTTRLDFSLIKPGLAANVKFGGCGSYPNLPWVSTTGSGPNSKTISGVTYRYSPTQIKIVCACHGTHMSPEEFVRHATEEQTTTQDGGGGGVVSSFPNSNYAASTQS
ncbi:unnamed protein product [Cuscuta epithymum]|uniref:Ninja-family protein n=1 Tax=Cuscuta epithymum TaxID=186058 RepID=A0AAV0DHQ9_9ASTE|nr:unnamed protein product [Cuscuta epithymum]